MKEKKERDEDKKGFWRTCPDCNGKDFDKITNKDYLVLTFQPDEEIIPAILRYTSCHGLPKIYNPNS